MSLPSVLTLPSRYALPIRFALLLAAAMSPCGARADCDLMLAQAGVTWVAKPVASLPLDESSAYRLLGSASPLLSGSCSGTGNGSAARIRIAVDGLGPAASDGLLAWPNPQGVAARMRLRVLRASVDGVAVPLSLTGMAAAPGHAPLPLKQDGVVELDLSALPPPAGPRRFLLTMQLEGLVPADYRPSTATYFSFTPRFSWRP